MTDDDRRVLGRTRRFAFQNLANGVPTEKVGVDLRLSPVELDQARRFVAKKITEFLVLRRQAPIRGDNVKDMRWNRKALLEVLSRIGDIDLSTDLILSKVYVQSFDHPEMIEGAQRRMQEAYR